MEAFLKIFVPAFVGLISGAVGSIIAPWIHWGIEKRRKQLEYRQSLIAEWRKMVKEITNLPDDENFNLAEVLERHEAFYSLKPHLSQNVISEVYRCRTVIAGSTIGAALLLYA